MAEGTEQQAAATQTNSGEQQTTTDTQTQSQQQTMMTADDKKDDQSQSQQASQQQTDDKGKEGDNQDPPKPEGAPEKYEFAPPEGQEFDAKFIEVYSEVAKELNLSQTNAQKILDRVSPIVQQQQMAKIQEVRAGWESDTRADAEFGGEKLDENIGIAKQALEKFGTPELKSFLNVTGIGNHPELVRFFYRAGKAITGDTFVGGRKEGSDNPTNPSQNFNSLAARLYGG